MENFVILYDTKSIGLKYAYKRDLTVEKQVARYLCNMPCVFHTPLPFYATQIINIILNTRISTNHDKGERF